MQFLVSSEELRNLIDKIISEYEYGSISNICQFKHYSIVSRRCNLTQHRWKQDWWYFLIQTAEESQRLGLLLS
jgi:hypothetical protein